jgi:hypothetical protein
MRIFHSVTALTASRKRHVALLGVGVTALTRESLMTTLKRKASPACVIESPEVPAIGIMAFRTAASQSAFVGVLRCVACVAGLRCLAELPAHVTLLA